MATIDASIPMGVRPVQIENPLNQLAKMMQVQSLQQEGQMNRLKMDEYQRSVQEQNRLSGLFRTGADATALRNAGFHKQALEWEEKNAKIKQDAAQAGKYEADTEKTALETKFKKIDLGAQILSTARDQASYDQARATAQANGLDVSRMPPQFDAGFVQTKLQESQSIKDQLEQVWKQKGYNLDVQKAGETARHNGATERTAAGQLAVSQGNLGVSRERLNVEQGNAVAESGGPSQVGLVKKFGKPEKGYRWKEDGTSEPIPGGSADLKNGADSVKKVNEAKDVLGILNEVDELLPNSTGSLMGRGYDVVAGGVGVSTKGGETAAKLKVLEGALISKMPKMSGPQSDKDVEMYRQMAGSIGDATVPVAKRQAAAAEIRRLNEKYAGVPEGSSKPPKGAFGDAEKERRYQEWKAKQ